MTELFDYMTGIAVIKAYTDNTALLADKLSASVKFKSFSAGNGEAVVTVGILDEKFTENIISSLGIPYEVINRRGLFCFARKYVKRVGIFLGALTAVILIFFLSNIVLKIEISGNSEVTEKEIISMLKDAGIDYGVFIPSVNVRKAEKSLLSMSDKFTRASVRCSGFRVIVTVMEGETKADVEMKRQCSNIIALYDAQITKVNVKSGMLLPMTGDTVRRGEILISGVVSKKFGGTYEVRAMGEITGQYRRNAQFTENYINTLKIYGEEFRNKYIKIFGKTFSFSGNSDIPKDAEFTSSSEYISFMGLTLPVEITVLDVMPYSYEKVTSSREELIENAKIRLGNFENNLLKESGEKIIDRKIKLSESEQGITLKAEYLLEGNIGIEKPFFPLETRESPAADSDEK